MASSNIGKIDNFYNTDSVLMVDVSYKPAVHVCSVCVFGEREEVMLNFAGQVS